MGTWAICTPLKCAPVPFTPPKPALNSVNIASLATRTAGWLRTSALIPSQHCRNMLAVAQQTRSAASPVARCEGRTCAMQQCLAPLRRGLSQRLGSKPAAAVPWAPALSRHRARPFGRYSMHEYDVALDVCSSSAKPTRNMMACVCAGGPAGFLRGGVTRSIGSPRRFCRAGRQPKGCDAHGRTSSRNS